MDDNNIDGDICLIELFKIAIDNNTKVMEKMVETNENENKRRFKIKIITTITIGILLIAFFICISLCEPMYVANNSSVISNNNSMEINNHVK